MNLSINDSDFMEQLANTVLLFNKEKLELIMREELSNFLTAEQLETKNSRNGFYSKTLETQFGKIHDLRVPRDRQGEFQTELFEPYQRRDGWLEEALYILLT